MSDQVETKQVTWQDLEVQEEPRYFEGLGEKAAQIHQALCAEIIDFEEGDEPVPTLQERFAEFSAHVREQQEMTEQQLGAPRGFLMLTGITAEEFEEAVTKNFPDGLQASGEFYTEVPVVGTFRAFVSPASQHEKLAKLARMYEGIEFGVASSCTPSRNPITLAEYERRLHNGE